MFATKPIKFEHNAQSKSYFWGCTHVHHQQPFIWKARGYNSPEEYAVATKEKINATCTEKDTLFLLGDGFLTSSPEMVEEFWFGLKPKIQYIWGNHESSTTRLYRKYRDEQYGKAIILSENTEIYPLYQKNLTFWGNYLEININGQCIVLSHYPFLVWNNSRDNFWSLHSHCHYSLPSSKIEATQGKILDVGVDGHKDAPISFDTIKSIMANKQQVSHDNHH